MDPSTLRGYMVWWENVQPTSLHMDEDDEEEDEWMVATLEGYSNEEPKKVDNLMHNILVQEPSGIPELGLEALVKVILLMVVGNTLSHTYWFITLFNFG